MGWWRQFQANRRLRSAMCPAFGVGFTPTPGGISQGRRTSPPGLVELVEAWWSGRRDLNPRPPRPKRGALPDCATSRNALSMPTGVAGDVRATKTRLVRKRATPSSSRVSPRIWGDGWRIRWSLERRMTGGDWMPMSDFGGKGRGCGGLRRLLQRTNGGRRCCFGLRGCGSR